MSTIVWLRNDLRIEDNPALDDAASHGPVVPLFIWDPEEDGSWTPGAASKWWLHQSLRELGSRFESMESRLLLRAGPTLDTLLSVAKSAGATRIVWNRRFEPDHVAADRKTWAALQGEGIDVASHNGSLLFDPREVRTQQGDPYRVFTPFWRALQASNDPGARLPAPKRLKAPSAWPSSDALESLSLEPRIDWAGGLREAWKPGESGAHRALRRFLEDGIGDYSDRRNRPDEAGTSRLSPHLHFGEISPRRMWREVREKHGGKGEPYLRQLAWREFAHHLLFHYPETTDEPLRPEFADFPWRRNKHRMKIWSKGRTGYPFVDAGMRELWNTGWMHNRVRMVVASFLVKDLLIPWQEGAAWFWDTLVDADLANNTLGWQWTAGCGADAAPYFRVFNPVTQGKKFDPTGAYIRRWIPELAEVPDAYVHEPWTMPAEEAERIGFDVGTTYPDRMVDHAVARDRSLEAYATIKGSSKGAKTDGNASKKSSKSTKSKRSTKSKKPKTKQRSGT